MVYLSCPLILTPSRSIDFNLISIPFAFAQGTKRNEIRALERHLFYNKSRDIGKLQITGR